MAFEDDMIEAGFYDEQDYLDYICDKACWEEESDWESERWEYE